MTTTALEISVQKQIFKKLMCVSLLVLSRYASGTNCRVHGAKPEMAWEGSIARDACCACGGGVAKSSRQVRADCTVNHACFSNVCLHRNSKHAYIFCWNSIWAFIHFENAGLAFFCSPSPNVFVLPHPNLHCQFGYNRTTLGKESASTRSTPLHARATTQTAVKTTPSILQKKSTVTATADKKTKKPDNTHATPTITAKLSSADFAAESCTALVENIIRVYNTRDKLATERIGVCAKTLKRCENTAVKSTKRSQKDQERLTALQRLSAAPECNCTALSAQQNSPIPTGATNISQVPTETQAKAVLEASAKDSAKMSSASKTTLPFDSDTDRDRDVVAVASKDATDMNQIVSSDLFAKPFNNRCIFTLSSMWENLFNCAFAAKFNAEAVNAHFDQKDSTYYRCSINDLMCNGVEDCGGIVDDENDAFCAALKHAVIEDEDESQPYSAVMILGIAIATIAVSTSSYYLQIFDPCFCPCHTLVEATLGYCAHAASSVLSPDCILFGAVSASLPRSFLQVGTTLGCRFLSNSALPGSCMFVFRCFYLWC